MFLYLKYTVTMQGDTDEVSQWIVSLQQNFDFSKGSAEVYLINALLSD